MADLTIDQLFTPAPSGVTTDPTAPVPTNSWLAGELSIAQTLNLDTTAWQPGGPERTILAIDAVELAQEDAIISVQAQGRFLDFAASGTVTTTNLDGTTTTVPVTPDPSIASQNPTGAPGWLDAVGQLQYGVTRIQATYASGTLAIANTSASSRNYSVGQYHAGNATTGATYANPLAITVPPSGIAGTGGVVVSVAAGVNPTIGTNTAHGLAIGDVVYILGVVGVSGLNGLFLPVQAVPSPTTFIVTANTSGTWTSGGTVYKCTQVTMQADVKGLSGNASPGQVTNAITSNVGWLISNVVPWSAANYESNPAYAARCRLKLGALSPNGPTQAYQYVALSASQLLAAQVPAVTLRNGPIAKAFASSNPVTEVTTVLVSSTTPASSTLGQPTTPGNAPLAIAGATNASPIVIATTLAHGLQNGDPAIVSGVLGNTAANGDWTVTVVDGTHVSLNGSSGSGAYTGGGTIEGGDLGEVDNLIQTMVVPDNDIAITQSSLAFPVSLIATVVVPQAYVATYRAAGPAAFQALLASFPIGNENGGPTTGLVPISAVEGALVDAGVLVVGAVSYVRSISGLTINGSSSDLAYPAPNYDALVGSVTLNVVGV